MLDTLPAPGLRRSGIVPSWRKIPIIGLLQLLLPLQFQDGYFHFVDTGRFASNLVQLRIQDLILDSSAIVRAASVGRSKRARRVGPTTLSGNGQARQLRMFLLDLVLEHLRFGNLLANLLDQRALLRELDQQFLLSFRNKSRRAQRFCNVELVRENFRQGGNGRLRRSRQKFRDSI